MSNKKKIAVIGGGSSGLITSYLLSKKYDITLYEKKAILGGNVQTLNKNVKGTKLPKHLNIENGVLGFSQNYYPNFHKLLDHLKVEHHSYKPSISLFSNHHFYPAKKSSYLNYRSLRNFMGNSKYSFEVLKLNNSKRKFQAEIEKSDIDSLSFSDFSFSQDLYKKYMQALFMLSFSTPFQHVQQLPQSIVNPYFSSLPNSTWSFIKGGVFTYMDHLINKTEMKIICNAKNIKISRTKNGTSLQLDRQTFFYDNVIIATTPGSVRHLLSDLTTEEQQIFNDFEDQQFKTLAHKDHSFYKPYNSVHKTPMDLFYKYSSKSIGYNTYLNNVYKINSKEQYSFAYNLDQEIDSTKIIHQANHIVPKYNKKHDAKMKLLSHINGQNNTYFAGAYTDNGLHEGAVVSAMKISNSLGGIKL